MRSRLVWDFFKAGLSIVLWVVVDAGAADLTLTPVLVKGDHLTAHQIQLLDAIQGGGPGAFSKVQDWVREDWHFGGVKQVVWISKSLGLRMNDRCKTSPSCVALSEVSEVLKKSDRLSWMTHKLNAGWSTWDEVGGKNPGSVVCKKALFASVVLGVSPRGNMDSFCSFEDGSFIANSTLVLLTESAEKL